MTCDCQLPAPPHVYELGCGDEIACCSECTRQVEPGPCRVCKAPGMHWHYCLRCALAVVGSWGDA